MFCAPTKFSLVACVGVAIALIGCSAIPTSGPTRSQITANPSAAGIQIVDVTDDVARRLAAGRRSSDFASIFGENAAFQQQLGVGDIVEVTIWEAPPAVLFSSEQADPKSATGSSHVTVLPSQVIDGNGFISVPFVGPLKAAGRTPMQLQQDIVRGLRGLAHDPQAIVKLAQNETSYVTVVGDVVNSSRLPLTARGERLLDALASAGGVRQPIGKLTLQLTRGNTVASLPLDSVIRDPRQNVPLHAGDVVTALFQPYSFMALGATGKNEEVNFEAQGITLAQALARSGGLQDSRSDAQGVFVFRMEDAKALDWPQSPVRKTADGKVPVVYRINLRDGDSFFVAQSFMIDNKDLLYVSNAPIAEVQKFLNVVFSVAYPVVTGVQTFR
ncbi:polysaccharide biosynthesis/export family protein [Burkholderia diffusa]|uniref:polysaccharide biosynthesis/export family protein n=1 Tax=Burkholderia diffusa TaxID=488732 RepID=UPI000757CB07|nr:polysaccharide biosynthesis/export family protein [Burkholderia diffusa]KVH43915.1 capsular biosynthesis protein [Burkholderia diffusa]